jgi:hypothetical protein
MKSTKHSTLKLKRYSSTITIPTSLNHFIIKVTSLTEDSLNLTLTHIPSHIYIMYTHILKQSTTSQYIDFMRFSRISSHHVYLFHITYLTTIHHILHSSEIVMISTMIIDSCHLSFQLILISQIPQLFHILQIQSSRFLSKQMSPLHQCLYISRMMSISSTS